VELTRGLEQFNLRDTHTPYPGNPYYITGALGLLDAPGEYFFDKQTNLLYFYPPWNGRPDARTLSMRHYLDVAVFAQNTSFVNIKNITVYGGGINMLNSNNNITENCRINYAEHFYESGWDDVPHFMRGGIVLTGSNNKISGCEIGYSAGNGAVLAGDDNIFTNNIVHNTGYSGNFFASLYVNNSNRQEISFNTFKDVARKHVYFHVMGKFNRCIVRNNYFENHGIFNTDCGAFYAFGSDGGQIEIYNNFVVVGNKGSFGSMDRIQVGLYIDNHTSNYIVRNNIIIGGGYGLMNNLWSSGTRFHNNTVVGSNYGISFYGFPVDNADASAVTFTDNLFVSTRNFDINYWGTENGRGIGYQGNFINGTIPVTQRPEGRMTSSGNARGTIDEYYRPTGNTPDIGAIPRGGLMFAYGADWNLGERR